MKALWFIQRKSGNSYHDVMEMPISAVIESIELLKLEAEESEKAAKRKK